MGRVSEGKTKRGKNLKIAHSQQGQMTGAGYGHHRGQKQQDVQTALFLHQVAIHLNSEACREMARNNPRVLAQRKRVVRMLVIIVSIFVLSWLPINVGE